MDNFIANKSQYLQDNGITPIVYGSMTFDNSAHFDFDISFIGMNENENVEVALESWTDELAASWKQVGTEGHITYTNLERLEKYVKTFQEDNHELIDEEDFDIFLYLFYGSSVLIGNYDYSDREEGNISQREISGSSKTKPVHTCLHHLQFRAVSY